MTSFNPFDDAVVDSIVRTPKLVASPPPYDLGQANLPSLMKPRIGYKPFAYPWAYDLWEKQQQVHWMPGEVPMGEDLKDWATRMAPHEKHLATQILRMFTQTDIEVQDNYMERLGTVFKPTEVKMMLLSFASMETIHVAAYSLLNDTLGLPESDYSIFMEYSAMRAKHDFLQQFKVDTYEDILVTLAVFGAIIEGMSIFASFAMLMNFPRFGKLRGMGQIVSWSVRDESLHAEGIIRLFHEFAHETGALTPEVGQRIRSYAMTAVSLEDNFIDLAFEAGELQELTAADVKLYVRFVADWRMRQLGLEELYGVSENPLPWLQGLLSGVEHANFFEARATEYSKAASRGTWQGVWDRISQ
jgi:ribonucleoside-diphosphate reductase beta chain